LPPDRGVSSEGDAGEVDGQILGRVVAGPLQKERFKLLECWRVDPHAGVPFWLTASARRDAASAVADGVPLKSDRVAAAVADLIPLLLLEGVMPFSSQQQEPVGVADVLHVGQPSLLPVRPLALGPVDPVFLDQLIVDRFTILPFGNPASHVPPVAVAQVADRDLLDESFRR